MDFGGSRKRLKKLAKRYSDEQLRDKVFGKAGHDEEGILYLTRTLDGDLRLSGWRPEAGPLDVFLEDDVGYFAVCDYLERNGLVFDTCEAAVVQMRGQ